MSLHPILALANESDVKQAKGFRLVAEKLTGAALESDYQTEVANAPRRSAQGLRHLGVRIGRKARERQGGKDDKHLAEAIVRSDQPGSPKSAQPLELPTGESIVFVDHAVPIKTAAADKAKGDADPNAGVEEIPLLAVIGEDRVAVCLVKYLEPESTRTGAGDTPLRFLLRGLGLAAQVDANREALRAEIAEAVGKTIGDEAPAIVIAGSPRYWQLSRKREAQKGAAWIRELERLAREIGESIGSEVFFVGLTTEGVPGWDYDGEGAVLSGPVGFEKSWEIGAGKVRPKPKARKVTPAEEKVEADLSRPVRRYSIRESFAPGDRINHSKLGEGVVQAAAQGKITVLFGDEKKLLIHERT